jgi:mRNA interferase RelE/StbE
VNDGKYQAFVSTLSKKFLDKIDKKSRKRLMLAIELIIDNPKKGKRMTGHLKGKLSWRVGEYRIIYQIIEERLHISIVKIGLRKEVYK